MQPREVWVLKLCNIIPLVKEGGMEQGRPPHGLLRLESSAPPACPSPSVHVMAIIACSA